MALLIILVVLLVRPQGSSAGRSLRPLRLRLRGRGPCFPACLFLGVWESRFPTPPQTSKERSMSPRATHHRVRRVCGVRGLHRGAASFISDFKARDYSYVAIYLIALSASTSSRATRVDLTRPWRIHGDRRPPTAILMAGNEQFGGPMRREGPLDASVAGSWRASWGWRSGSGAPTVGPPRARDLCRRGACLRLMPFRGVLGRRNHPALRHTGAHGLDSERACPRPLAHANDWMYYLAWSIALLLFAVAWLVLRGQTGRAFRAVRE